METQITFKSPYDPGPEHQHRQFGGQASLCDGFLIFSYSKKTMKPSVIIGRNCLRVINWAPADQK